MKKDIHWINVKDLNWMASEKWAKAELESKGWEVLKLMKKTITKEGKPASYLDIIVLQNFLKNTSHDKKRLRIVDCLRELNQNGDALPDFIAKKKKRVMFVEVKNMKSLTHPEETFNGEPKVKQLKAIKDIWDRFHIKTEIQNIVIDIRKETWEEG